MRRQFKGWPVWWQSTTLLAQGAYRIARVIPVEQTEGLRMRGQSCPLGQPWLSVKEFE